MANESNVPSPDRSETYTDDESIRGVGDTDADEEVEDTEGEDIEEDEEEGNR